MTGNNLTLQQSFIQGNFGIECLGFISLGCLLGWTAFFYWKTYKFKDIVITSNALEKIFLLFFPLISFVGTVSTVVGMILVVPKWSYFFVVLTLFFTILQFLLLGSVSEKSSNREEQQ